MRRGTAVLLLLFHVNSRVYTVHCTPVSILGSYARSIISIPQKSSGNRNDSGVLMDYRYFSNDLRAFSILIMIAHYLNYPKQKIEGEEEHQTLKTWHRLSADGNENDEKCCCLCFVPMKLRGNTAPPND